jgi:hypothetical protein
MEANLDAARRMNVYDGRLSRAGSWNALYGAIEMQTNLRDTHWDGDEIRQLIRALEELQSGMHELEASLASRTGDLDEEHKDSAKNLIHYLALRGARHPADTGETRRHRTFLLGSRRAGSHGRC